MPAEFNAVVNWAMLIVLWQENLPEDEMPPRWMWALDDELNDYFEKLKEARKRKFGIGDDDQDDVETSGPMLKNELAENRGRNLR